MGYLRTLLAITVIFNHTQYGAVFTGGQLAVQMFYVISGFLIQHVLRLNPNYRNPLTFYANRALRIYPLYFVVALLTLIYVLAVDQSILDVYRVIPQTAQMFLAVSNLTIFGQDWVMFAGAANGALQFAVDFRKFEPELWHGLLVPQAWSLLISHEPQPSHG